MAYSARPVAPCSRHPATGRTHVHPEERACVSSNISQSYPYGSESEEDRAAAIARALGRFDGLYDKVAAETTSLDDIGPAENGAPPRWWTWVCPKDDFMGRLHVAGYARERHALYTVCDTCGTTYLR